MAKSIKFTKTGSSSTLGSFGPGDIARNLPDDMADHLVNEANCAEYWQPTAPAAKPVEPAAPEGAADPTPAAAKRAPRAKPATPPAAAD